MIPKNLDLYDQRRLRRSLLVSHGLLQFYKTFEISDNSKCCIIAESYLRKLMFDLDSHISIIVTSFSGLKDKFEKLIAKNLHYLFENY